MRYLVKARVKPGHEKALVKAIESGELGRGSVVEPDAGVDRAGIREAYAAAREVPSGGGD